MGRLCFGEDYEIVLNDDEVDILAICAVRYAMGRQSYMPSTVQEIVGKHLFELNGHTLSILEQDCKWQREYEVWGDEAVDRPGWERFEAAVKAEIARRTNE